MYYNLNKDFICDFQNCNEDSANLEFKFIENRQSWDYRINFDNQNIDSKDITVIKYTDEDFKILNHLPYIEGLKQPYIPYGKGYTGDLAKVFFDNFTTNRAIEMDFMERMKTFIPNIERISPNNKDGIILIRDADFPQDRPLDQYGEGANKLFRILVLLTLHKGKKLLIDEIDAGIHYSRFKKFWSIILEIALKDNTQIIATTHNEECIRYFTEVLNELGDKYQTKSRVVQMKMVKNIKIRCFEFDSFNIAKEDGLEIRGGE